MLLFLVEGENGELRVILVHLHVVFQILVGGGGREGKPVCLPFQVQAVVECSPPVGARVVDADRLYGSGCRIVLTVWEGFLGDIIVIERVLGHELVRYVPVQLESSAGRLLFVCFTVVVFVDEETVVPVIIAVNRDADVFTEFAVLGNLCFSCSVITHRHGYLRSLVGEGREGIDVDDSSHCITPVKSSLRTTEDFDALDVIQLEIESTFVQIGDVVYIKSDRLPAASCPDSADIDG